MIFAIIIIAAVGAIAFFHYLQGFFSATLSAIFTVIAAVVAVSYHEMIVEKLLGTTLGEWGPALVLLVMFGLTYLLLRVLFDKMIPGQLNMPATVDKIGGGAMGAVAGVFAMGTVVIAAHQLPFGPSLAGYTRYETLGGDRMAVLPQPGQTRAKDVIVFDELSAPTFENDKVQKLLLPVDDVVVETVAHLSDGGSLGTDKPLTSVHPDYLQELFGQRLGIEIKGAKTLANLPGKSRAVDVVGIYRLANSYKNTTDGEFARMRDGDRPVKHPEPVGGEMRVVVRTSFASSAGDKDRRVRLSPGNVRLVAQGADESGNLEPRNYYPIGTLDPNGFLYYHKVDDPLYIETSASRIDGSPGPAEVDFVFQVPEAGLLAPGSEKEPEPKIAPGTFIEVKKLARIDLSEGDKGVVKPIGALPPPRSLAVRRKNLDWTQGPAPIKGTSGGGGGGSPMGGMGAMGAMAGAPGGGGGPPRSAAPAPVAAAAPTPLSPQQALMRMVGTWSNAAGFTYTFKDDGTYTASQAATATAPAKSGGGKWKVAKVDATQPNTVELELVTDKGTVNTNRWRLDNNKQITRLTPAPETPFTRA
jgi:hypothetical protein